MSGGGEGGELSLASGGLGPACGAGVGAVLALVLWTEIPWPFLRLRGSVLCRQDLTLELARNSGGGRGVGEQAEDFRGGRGTGPVVKTFIMCV